MGAGGRFVAPHKCSFLPPWRPLPCQRCRFVVKSFPDHEGLEVPSPYDLWGMGKEVRDRHGPGLLCQLPCALCRFDEIFDACDGDKNSTLEMPEFLVWLRVVLEGMADIFDSNPIVYDEISLLNTGA